jgi:sRNA-binding protein
MKIGASRIDLDGNAAGVVTADAAEHATQELTAVAERAKIAQANVAKAATEQANSAEKKAEAAAQAQRQVMQMHQLASAPASRKGKRHARPLPQRPPGGRH